MRSKAIDEITVPKIWQWVGLSSYPLLPLNTVITVATLSFQTIKPGVFRFGHYINCQHDGGSAIVGAGRQLTIDGVGLYTYLEYGVGQTPYIHTVTSGEIPYRLLAGSHTLSLGVSANVGNILTVYDGLIYVQEL